MIALTFKRNTCYLEGRFVFNCDASSSTSKWWKKTVLPLEVVKILELTFEWPCRCSAPPFFVTICFAMWLPPPPHFGNFLSVICPPFSPTWFPSQLIGATVQADPLQSCCITSSADGYSWHLWVASYPVMDTLVRPFLLKDLRTCRSIWTSLPQSARCLFLTASLSAGFAKVQMRYK